MHAPLQPIRIFGNHRVRVFAQSSPRPTISDREFKEQILDRATYTGWPGAPLSWDSWQADIRQELAKGSVRVAHNAYEAERWFGPLFVRETGGAWSLPTEAQREARAATQARAAKVGPGH